MGARMIADMRETRAARARKVGSIGVRRHVVEVLGMEHLNRLLHMVWCSRLYGRRCPALDALRRMV